MTVTLRAPRSTDLEALTEMWSRPEVIRHTSRLPFLTEDFARIRITAIPSNMQALVAEWDGKAVGFGSLLLGERRQRHKASLALAVHDAVWGRGIGTALMTALLDIADNWAGVTRVQLEVLANNPRAIALYERHGFEREGVLRNDMVCDGALIDTIVMARLHAAPARAITP